MALAGKLTPNLKELFKKNIALPWVILFLLVNIIARGTGGHNEGARLATMRAMSEKMSFVINDYPWGDDWSINDKGEKFANKAPGPMFIGFPIYYVIDAAFKDHDRATLNEDGYNTTRLSATPRAIFSIIMQVIPFALFLLWLGRFLIKEKIPEEGIHFALAALALGNTSAIFMNTYFGHGMAAAFSLGLFLALYKKNHFYTGLFYGMTLLCEYAAAIVFPFVFLTMLAQSKDYKKSIIDLVKGGLVPGLLWSWYHISAFGSPFQTAIQHENPIFFEGIDHSNLLFGMFSLPNFDTLIELLFGQSRGILFTQPFVLFFIFLFPFLLKKGAAYKKLSIYTFASLVAMVLMNSSFNGWHGGMNAGPRYLSIVLAPVGLYLAFEWKKLAKWEKVLYIAGLAFALDFRGRVFATTILTPTSPQWQFQMGLITEGGKALFRYGLYFVLLGLTLLWIKKRAEKIDFSAEA